MTEIEKLEAQRQKLATRQKEATKALRAAKRREARKAAQAKKEAEQAEAVKFVEFAKQHKVHFGSGENQTWKYLYDWVESSFKEWVKSAQADGAPGRAQ